MFYHQTPNQTNSPTGPAEPSGPSTGGRADRRRRTDKAPGSSDSCSKTTSPAGIRKSLRARVASTKTKSHLANGNKSQTLKSRSRKHILKKDPVKLSPAPPLISMVQSVRLADVRFNVGDIVSVVDIDDGVYYAQLRALAVDAVGNSCCALTWLVPTSDTTSGTFEPENYMIGMEEDILRDLNCCSLVCRCPSDYYRPVASPYDIQSFS
ncbi:GATA zinc finger domain-containing protein 1 [Fasciola gigantica]|uniref:GATA zinc finger domain-containing protein 1 n=1 Tax=Fasciola gigantica TaxID=46835 RepID=A0A504Z2G9_FASGI|nr:GATA zinc finger domain-containing protein 1 [Fasciola gigantica]